MRPPMMAAWAAIAAYALYLRAAYDDLPARTAAHFDLSGRADGYQERATFALATLLVVTLLGALFTALPWLMRRLPDGLINVPHRAYWLAPARREATLRTIETFNDRLGLATVAMTCALFVLIIRANVDDARLGASAWVLLGGFIALTISLSFGLMRAFRRPRD